MESPSTFGEWLRQRRNELHLTREQFAERLGCSVSALRKIEDGERRPSGQIAELLANCLDIPSTERSTFVKVARGEWSLDRLASASKPIASPSASSAATTSRMLEIGGTQHCVGSCSPGKAASGYRRVRPRRRTSDCSPLWRIGAALAISA
jgi:transcriptional regulator with XRE-family HTH domain